MGVRRRGPGLSRAAAVLLALALGACAGLSDADEARLEIHRDNARRFFQAGDYLRSLHQATMALALDEDDATMSLVRGHSLLRLGASGGNPALVQEALDLFEELYDDRPDDDRAALSLANARLARALQLQDEIEAEERRLQSEFLAPSSRADGQRSLAALHRRRATLLEDAEELLRDVLDDPLQKDNPGGLTDLVLVLHARGGREAEALPLAQRALQLLDESNALARQARESNPNLPASARLELDNLLATNREKELALRELVATAALLGGDTDTYFAQMAEAEQRGLLGEVQYRNRAGVLEGLGRWEEAARDLDMFLRLRARRFPSYADDPLASETFQRIEDLRGRAHQAPR